MKFTQTYVYDNVEYETYACRILHRYGIVGIYEQNAEKVYKYVCSFVSHFSFVSQVDQLKSWLAKKE